MTDSKKRRPAIIAFGPGIWRPGAFGGSTRNHIWSISKRDWPVVYIDPPIRWHWKTKTWKAEDRDFTAVSLGTLPLFAVSKIPTDFLSETMRALTSKLMVKQALKVCQELGYDPQLVWLGAPWHASLIDHLPSHLKTVHHVYDELSESPILRENQKGLLKKWEEDLWRKVDKIFCISNPLYQKRKEGGKSGCYLIDNSINESAFDAPTALSENDVAEKFMAMPEPRCVYAGVVDLRSDPKFYREILKNIGSGSLLFLGNFGRNADSFFTKELAQHPNVYFSGRVPNDVLVQLCHRADVLIHGHKLTPFTQPMFSAKFLEYLATGNPILSVRMPEMERVSAEASEEPIVYFVDEYQEIAPQLQAAMREDSQALREARISLARKRTWSIAAEIAEQHFLELLDQD